MDHGLDLSNPHLLAWSAIFPVAHATLALRFRAINFCPALTPKKERGSDIVAVCIVSAIGMLFSAVIGTMAFFNINGFLGDDHAQCMQQDRLFARNALIENYIIIPMICYQAWNLLVCLSIAEFRTPDSIGHHIVTLILAYFVMGPYCQYYAMFFFGVAEVTTVPLNVMYIFKYVPELAQKYPVIAGQSRNIFGLSFVIVRLCVWPVICYDFWRNSYKVYVSKRIHSEVVFGFFLFANTFLTFLQVYWGYLIIKGALKSKSKSGGSKNERGGGGEGGGGKEEEAKKR